MRRALGKRPKDTRLPRPRVSREARAHHEGDQAWQLAAHPVLVLLALAVGICLYSVVGCVGGCWCPGVWWGGVSALGQAVAGWPTMPVMWSQMVKQKVISAR